jgi:hypothetical protein
MFVRQPKFSFFWKVGQIWWLLFIPIFLLHWLSPLLAGLLAKKRRWVYWAMYYLATVVLLFIATPMPDVPLRNLFIGIFVFSWLGCFIHSIIIADKFIRVMIDNKLGRNFEKRKLTRAQQSFLKGHSPKQKQWMQILLVEKKEILENYNKIDPVLQNEMLDVLEMVENYIDYANELMTKELELEKAIKELNIINIEQKIRQLNHQMSKTTNANLKNQYMHSIDNYKKQKDIYLNFLDKKKQINLKFESNIGKLREIKYDLIEMKFKSSREEKDSLLKKANELSEDMTVFVENLKYSPNEFDR